MKNPSIVSASSAAGMAAECTHTVPRLAFQLSTTVDLKTRNNFILQLCEALTFWYFGATIARIHF